MRKRFLITFLCAVALPAYAQTKTTEAKSNAPCARKHVRFTTEDHLKILQAQILSERAWVPYAKWEAASHSIHWFDGKKPVSLDYVKSHMPRAMLLSLRFPVDQNPRVLQSDLDNLLKAEREYEEAEEVVKGTWSFVKELRAKYGLGAAIFDKDMGGATSLSDCEK